MANTTKDENGVAKDKYYSLGMIDKTRTQALDITDIMRQYSVYGTPITLFDSAVWKQLGNDVNLIFDNMVFKNVTDGNDLFNLLTGARGNSNGMEPAVGYHENSPPTRPTMYGRFTTSTATTCSDFPKR